MTDRLAREVQELVQAALARHGTAGSVRIEGQLASLVGNGPLVTEPIEHLLGQWENLPFEERQRQSGNIARALARKRFREPPPPTRQTSAPIGVIVALALVLGAGAYYLKASRGGPAPAEAQATAAAGALGASDAEAERAERADRVCNSTRTRLARGATVNPSDAEGWVVELSLVRSADAGSWPALEPLVRAASASEPAQIVWEGLIPATARDSVTRVVMVDELLPEHVPQYRSRSLTLFGQYVLPYFRERERIKLVRFAHALAEAQRAELGALYARCEASTARHMGSWFLGHSPGAAAASLLYFLGAHADPPQLPAGILSSQAAVAFEPAFALSSLIDKTRGLKKQDVAGLIGAQDGMVAGPTNFTTLGFPFVESDRALRASLSMASRLDEPPFAAKRRAAPPKLEARR
jgi:hypothetical protein